MIRALPTTIGYHGCDSDTGERALNNGVDLKPSNRSYDWLGPGVYFWENDPLRALEWAEAKVTRGSYKKAFVIGAVINLGHCLDLTLRENVDLLKPAYEGLRALNRAANLPMPRNQDSRSKIAGDKTLRYRDCAVIKHLHTLIGDAGANVPDGPDHVAPFDTVRGLFVEGKPVYPGGGFFAQSHTQIAVISGHSILGVFRPSAIAR